MTSSQGELIDFSETFIIFTSNIGSSKIPPSKDHKENRRKFKEAVVNKFRNEIQRPEILNRIGEHNIIPFNYIMDDKIIKDIFISKLKMFTNFLYEKHSIKITYEKDNLDDIYEIVKHQYDNKNGGRGLIASIEKTIQYELSNFIFDNQILDSQEDDKRNIKLSSFKNTIKFSFH